MIACIRIPYFAAILTRPFQSQDEPKPLIIVQYKSGRGKVYAACDLAVNAGVQVGMTISRARVMCPEALIEMASPGQVRRAVDDLLHMLSDYSQWLEAKRHPAQTAVFYVDLGRLLPTEGRGIAEQILETLYNRGLQASVGLASGKFTAAVAAALTPSGKISLIRKGEEASYLAPLSTAYLPLDNETSRRLQLLGLRRMGQLVTLPRPALIEQFGKIGGQLHRLASGEDHRQVAKYSPGVHKVAKRQFEPPLSDRLILESVLATLCSDTATQLQTQGLACRRLLLTLLLDNHNEIELETNLRVPLNSSSQLYRKVQPLLDRFQITSAITEVSLQVSKLAPVLPRQLSLFDSQPAEQLSDLLVDLIDQYGEDVFYRILPHNTPARLPELSYHFETIEAA